MSEALNYGGPEEIGQQELIGCDSCGAVAPSSAFAFGEFSPEFAIAVALRGYDMSREMDRGMVGSLSAGLACKQCGNFSEFDLNPNTFPYSAET